MCDGRAMVKPRHKFGGAVGGCENGLSLGLGLCQIEHLSLLLDPERHAESG